MTGRALHNSGLDPIFLRECESDKKPGTEWLYSNFNTYMISCAIEKRAGVNLLEYLKSLFEPLGIGNPDWTLCPKGHVHAANGLYVNIDEFTRYGQMILHKGNYNGKQLVPESYMKMATSIWWIIQWQEVREIFIPVLDMDISL